MNLLDVVLSPELRNTIRSKVLGSNWKESTFFSQHGEDVTLRMIFKLLKVNKTDGFFVDIGAYHPTAISNTFYFYLKGWRGINVDPSPESIRLFNQYRPEDINVQAGVSDERGVLKYHIMPGKPMENSFDDSHIAGRGNDDEVSESMDVEVMPLGELLDQYLPAGQTIDFFSIDVEGMNYKVIESNNWDKYRPQVVLVEKHLDDELDQRMLNLLYSKDYKLVQDFYNNFFLVQDPNKDLHF